MSGICGIGNLSGTSFVAGSLEPAETVGRGPGQGRRTSKAPSLAPNKIDSELRNIYRPPTHRKNPQWGGSGCFGIGGRPVGKDLREQPPACSGVWGHMGIPSEMCSLLFTQGGAFLRFSLF